MKFGPSTPTGSSAGGSNNPTLSGTAFSDGTDGDTTHSKTTWQIAHNTDADWATPEWSRITTTGLISAVVNTTDGGAFANGDVGQAGLIAAAQRPCQIWITVTAGLTPNLGVV